MKVKISNTFIKTFTKDFALYHLAIEDLVTKLQEASPIKLAYPIVKYKCHIKGVSIRGLCIIKDDTIVPLYFTTKNSKQGANLVLDNIMTKKIELLTIAYQQDFTNGLFQIRE